MKYVALGAKGLLSVGLLALVFWRIDFGQVITFLARPATSVGVILAFAGLIVQGVLAAYRQIEILAILDHRIGFSKSVRIWFSGLFVTQVAVTFIAGDVVRGVQLTGAGVPRRIAGRAIVLDRMIGLAVLLAMVAAIVPYALTLIDDAGLRLGFLLLAAVSIAAVISILAAGYLQSLFARLPVAFVRHRLFAIAVDLASVSRFLFTMPWRSLRIAGLSLVMHLLNVFGIVVIALSLGVEAPMEAVAAIAVPVLLLAMLPISFAGWGVREAAVVTGFGQLHVPIALALATSVGFGLSMLLAGLLGMFSALNTLSLRPGLVRPSELPRN